MTITAPINVEAAKAGILHSMGWAAYEGIGDAEPWTTYLEDGDLVIVTGARLAALEKLAAEVRDDPLIPNSSVRAALVEIDALDGVKA